MKIPLQSALRPIGSRRQGSRRLFTFHDRNLIRTLFPVCHDNHCRNNSKEDSADRCHSDGNGVEILHFDTAPNKKKFGTKNTQITTTKEKRLSGRSSNKCHFLNVRNLEIFSSDEQLHFSTLGTYLISEAGSNKMLGVLWLLTELLICSGQFAVGQTADFLAVFPQIEQAMYQEPLPAQAEKCLLNLPFQPNEPPGLVSEDTLASQLTVCSATNLCVVAAGATLTMDASLNLGALRVLGELVWSDESQAFNKEQWLCAGYVLSEANGVVNVTVLDAHKKAYIYIKNNGANHDGPNHKLGYRFLGGLATAESLPGRPILDIHGRPVSRTWSQLAQPASLGDIGISLLHRPADMGWRVGDRIGLAPTGKGDYLSGETARIAQMVGHKVILYAPLSQAYQGDPTSFQLAEIVLLSRNVLITGAAFQEVSAGRMGCSGAFSLSCTMGLHTILAGAGLLRLQYARLEKCGQRGMLARYCAHFHHTQACPDCLLKGNAIEGSVQRGIVVHGTHLATVADNVLYDVRGAGIYIEDGNELWNRVEYNVVICPHAFRGALGGCTLPGTDNSEADGSANQAALWALSHSNHFVGNHAANAFNGLLLEPSFASFGRGASLNKICTVHTRLGRLEGNVLHSCGRFGTYFVADNYPRALSASVASRGWAKDETCEAFLPDGTDNGVSATVKAHVDYHNAFVGAYHMGDIQMWQHRVANSNNLIYHKETKSFADGCSSHFRENHYTGPGALALPSGSGAILFEDCTFSGDAFFEPNLHCNIGRTGALCNPVYVLLNPRVELTSKRWFKLNEFNSLTHGGSFVLAPPHGENQEGNLFPKGYQSLTTNYWAYLLDFRFENGGRICVRSAELGLGERYDEGILCKGPLRRLVVWTDTGSAAALKLNVQAMEGRFATSLIMPFMAHGDKNGFTAPVLAIPTVTYTLTQQDGRPIPASYVIEFSDPVFGNRWSPDKIVLSVPGWTCPPLTSSQHDRRFIYSDSFSAPARTGAGHGACSTYPDMPEISCDAQAELDLTACPELCPTGCSAHAFCDCGTQACTCQPGYSGPDCKEDICASARCGPHGTCTARYLGGAIPVTQAACICIPPWNGPTCESNPCEGVSCSGNGHCVSDSATTFHCECTAPYTGPDCAKSCELCKGIWPYGCATHIPGPAYCQAATGACWYSNNPNPTPPAGSSWCCFKDCDACSGVECPPASNDCHAAPVCVDGKCSAEVPLADGTVCHSVPWGVCRAGVCMAGPLGSTTAAPTTSTTMPATTTPATTTTAAPQPNCFLDDIDYYGNDLYNLYNAPEVPSAQSCQELCAQEPVCKAWTWVKPIHPNPGGYVWNPSTMCDGYTAQARADWLTRVKGMSQEAAQQQVMAEFPDKFGCSRDIRLLCFLKSSPADGSGGTPQPGLISGPKTCASIMASKSPTSSVSVTASRSASSASVTASGSATSSVSKSITSSASVTSSKSVTRSASVMASQSLTRSASVTASQSVTRSVSVTASRSATRSVSPPSTATPATSCFLSDIDFFGNDLSKVPQVPSAQSCQELCMQQAACVAWIWIKPTNPNPGGCLWNPSTMCDGYTAQTRADWLMRVKGMSQDAAQKQVMAEFPDLFGSSGTGHLDCFLKSSPADGSGGTPQLGVTSGSKACACFLDEMDYYGNDLKNVPQVPSAHSCQMLCAQEPACQAWTWMKPTHPNPGGCVWNQSAMCDGYTAQARADWLMRVKGMSQNTAQQQVMKEFPDKFGCSAMQHLDCYLKSSVGSGGKPQPGLTSGPKKC
eukprot:g74680.t1